ncbi:hypothetical protein YC2023_059746 [Brassica napus]
MKDSVEEMFPQWSGEDNDPQLVNLITDIQAGRFVRGFWEVQGKEKKRKLKGGVSSEAEPPNKKNKKEVKKYKKVNTSEGEAAATGKGSNEEALMTIMTTLDHISRKFDQYEGQFETIDLRFNSYEARNMPNRDQKTIDDIVKASVDERLKHLGVGESAINYDKLSSGPELASPQPNAQQNFVNSPTLAKPQGKGLGAKNKLAEDLDTASEVKKTLVDEFGRSAATPAKAAVTPAKAAAKPAKVTATPAKAAATPNKDADALDLIYVSPAKVDKDAKGGKGGGRRGNPKQKDDETVLTKKEAAAKKKEEAALKRKEAAEKKEKTD